ncbi:hypothetical protein L226DRAFT_114372 [Lentinus tigrinus ALCF2SS1-7]|uniref:uncharacterized protein n=1 Tax=Lentinus tigrinus ALCF2SS1-7 TaxID=1328758 RepID=UPI001165E17A|nr:hypothetical protein L226DRAFT_114372 [Lentinus tigrinus ALCF2SS1-7]
MSKSNSGMYEPEFRLVSMLFGVFGYVGWAVRNDHRMLWIGAVVCITMLNISMVVSGSAAVTYLLDTHRANALHLFALSNFGKKTTTGAQPKCSLEGHRLTSTATTLRYVLQSMPNSHSGVSRPRTTFSISMHRRRALRPDSRPDVHQAFSQSKSVSGQGTQNGHHDHLAFRHNRHLRASGSAEAQAGREARAMQPP